MPMMFETECYAIRGAVYEVYSKMGQGFAEEVYQEALEMELADRGIPFVSQQRLQIRYKERLLSKVYIPDFVCYGKIIVEIKAVHALSPEHGAQVINYLRATSLPMGLLVNFGSFPKSEIETFTNRTDFKS